MAAAAEAGGTWGAIRDRSVQGEGEQMAGEKGDRPAWLEARRASTWRRALSWRSSAVEVPDGAVPAAGPPRPVWWASASRWVSSTSVFVGRAWAGSLRARRAGRGWRDGRGAKAKGSAPVA